MAIKFVPASGNEANFAIVTTSLGTGLKDATICWSCRAPDSTKLGLYCGIQWSTTANVDYLNFTRTGTYTYLNVNASWVDYSISGAGGYMPNDTWWFFALRIAGTNNTPNSGNWYGSIYNGTSWLQGQNGGAHTHFNSSSGPDPFAPAKLHIGRNAATETGYPGGDFPSLQTNHVVDNLEVSYLRYWNSTWLDDSELLAERTSRTPVKAGCTKHFKFMSSLSDDLGGDPMSVGGVNTPTTNANEPGYMVDASAAKNLLLQKLHRGFGPNRTSGLGGDLQ